MIDQEQITKFFTAMGDPIRLQIVFLLREKPLNVGEIAHQFNISRPAISHHLKVLKEAKVLQSEKVGQEVYYSMNKSYIVGELRNMADKLEQIANKE
jgi:DNA-binding transcriptional ArsR family regulator